MDIKKSMKVLSIIIILGLAVAFTIVAGWTGYQYGVRNGIESLKYDRNNIIMVGMGDGKDFSIYKDLKYEIFRLVFKDGVYLQVISKIKDVDGFSEHKLFINSTYIRRLVRSVMKRELSDVELMIHNHPVNPVFSKADVQCANELRGMGFKGDFLLWHKGKVKKWD